VPKISTIADVVAWRLCIGCGACAYFDPQRVQLLDFPEEGIRPVITGNGAATGETLAVCPAVQTTFIEKPTGLGNDVFKQDWGQVLEIWEGYATDPDIRFKGSSGGALTALSAWCVEQGGMHGVLHTGRHPDDPIRNQTRLSRTRTELMAAMGSRYSPASVCDGLALVEQAPAPCAVIGKPGEIAALTNARKLRPQLDAKTGVTMSFFCAETPPTAGTLTLLGKLGVQSDDLADLRYRGYGWPGHFAPTRKGEAEPCAKMTYAESWAFLQKFRPWSVQLWPDGSGELADISCGDPWYEQPDGKNPGFSLVVVRTERGREIVRQAKEAGYLKLTVAEPWKLDRSQSGLARKKAAVWGRLQAMRLSGLPVPRFTHANLFRCWWRLRLGEKLQSSLGTLRRIYTRRLWRSLVLKQQSSHASSPSSGNA
jgi:coenzyme F420 hydrogenase subunit beta